MSSFASRRLCALGVAVALAAAAAEPLSWSFSDGLQGWSPANWERLEATPDGLHGLTRYDAQLLSPPLAIRAEDYPLLLVLLRTDRTGPGETFFAAPGQDLSDDRQSLHTITAGPDLRLYRIDLRRAKGPWAGPIKRLRFDPLNLAGATVTISLIALLPDPDAMLANGDAEVLRDGEPYQWTASGAPGKATVLDGGAASGRYALRLQAKGAWETAPIDLSFLGVFRVAGRVRGSGCALDVRFTGARGPLAVSRQFPLAGGVDWGPFAVEFEVPDVAFDMVLRFTQAARGQTDLDALCVEQLRRGDIAQPPPPKPSWRAAWVWHPDRLAADGQTAFFRTAFDLPPGDLRSAVLQITADDAYGARLNEQEVGRTFGEMDGWRTPEWLEVRGLLRPGPNRLWIEARDVSGPQGLIAELTVLFSDGRELRVLSGREWETAVEPAGPWQPARELGRVPCQPWGDLGYTPMGRLGAVEVALRGSPRQARVGEHVAVDVVAVAREAVAQSVAARVLLVAGDKVLQQTWGSRLLFAGAEPAGTEVTLSDVGLDIPASAPAGPAELRVELVGATPASPPRSRAIALRAADTGPHEFPQAEVVLRNGVPQILVEGGPVDVTQHQFTRPDMLQQRYAVESGVSVWTVALEEMGLYETGYDYSAVDRTLAQYLAAKPDAWLILTFSLDTHYHPWWLKQHPEALCAMAGGETVIGDYAGARRQLPSYGSPAWRTFYTDIVRNLIRHLRTTPYAERIIGFHPCSGISWEWFHWGSQSGELVDYSPAGQEDFRRWLRERYGTGAGLQAAWGRAEVSVDTAQVPSEARRRGPAKGLFFDPVTQRDVLDYNDYQHDIVADTILHFGRLIKEETGGRSLFGTYYGYVTHLPESAGFCQGSGHFRLQRLLDAPEVDFLMAPVAYAWRELGGTAATMTAAGSFPLHGKLFWNQADLRTHWSEQEGFGNPADVRGSIACMRRELARNLAEGSAIQWYDFSLGWTLGDRRLTDEARRLAEAGAARLTTPDWPPEDYLLVVVDERQMGSFDPFRPPYGLHLINAQREQLARSGVPHRIVLWSDLLQNPDLLRHRAMLLLNLFRLDDAEVDFLAKRVLADGRLVAIVGPVGLLGARGVDPTRPSRILGRPMAADSADLPLQARFADGLGGPWETLAGVTLGTPQSYPPIAVPAEAVAAHVLATLVPGGGPAIVYDENADRKLFWSAVPGLPPALLRALADVAGIPVVCRTDDAIYAGRGFIGIHATQPGEKQVYLPRPGRVEDLVSGQRWPAGTSQLSLTMNAGDTVILRTGGR